ncbi:hypothetical protein SELMODRAFT_167284 [Selaginella moellendorffii]|uniref:Peroxidase n=1 Tax=Selaginella moellendorffii TaxID=88036 RepID=D8R2E6_SELML|nr:peroxidase 29 [Selaginella moellendorffii]EFJ33714.1 hypothetical protein SELMODRAFT_167284 [Selaginella moellendorffii]|eukprot:XP_024525769.1 peroxidase 29 [Selaginella moellendorffii]
MTRQTLVLLVCSVFLLGLSNSEYYSVDTFGGNGFSKGLRFGFYAATCPNVETIVRESFTSNIFRDPTAAGALIRLAFHDCQVGGCDASILLSSSESITSELVSDRNFGIRRLDFIDSIKSALEASCPGVVSCADIIALAARDSIRISGGPNIPILLGRRDSTSASNLAADRSIPLPTISVDDTISLFQSKGMTLQETVAILGAHTVGVGHCVSVLDRLYPTQDPNLLPPRSAQLRAQCPPTPPQLLNNNTFFANDFTNVFFDNQYFRDILNGQGLFGIDSKIALDKRTSRIVSMFATNQAYFFAVFSSAFNKMLASNVLTGSSGEIRRDCKVVNS